MLPAAAAATPFFMMLPPCHDIFTLFFSLACRRFHCRRHADFHADAIFLILPLITRHYAIIIAAIIAFSLSLYYLRRFSFLFFSFRFTAMPLPAAAMRRCRDAADMPECRHDGAQ